MTLKYFDRFRTKRELISAVKAANPGYFSRSHKRLFKDYHYDVEPDPGAPGWWLFVNVNRAGRTLRIIDPETLELRTYIKLENKSHG